MNENLEVMTEALEYWTEGLEVPVDTFMKLNELGYNAQALQDKHLN
tara:strand:+ start:308 stop:445 length:138 start_codon:yes stop_codon:yes gene_type:complete